MNNEQIDPLDDENPDVDNQIQGDENGEPTGTDLRYDADEDSYELEVPSDDPDYDPPALFETAAKNGSDMNSDYDEANPYDIQGEYDRNRSIETDADSLGMHVEDASAEEVSAIDKALAHTPEDDRDDLDEEGYPINDAPAK
ncbi:hypothetical protein [Mucilaginibacter ginkgonis]|uniref:DUF5709 domain-containing protein n=1 Tax=Mucilaginibacter ginkgonis TaxID=2682091 RepID=A0A6I4I129_9SPHI|nr:hypothetical protein [Mucilaginibacter ginkgonis]QQL48600.1 hypothetical protein GO620_010435 [Mucilaginibacter ginkgonis]